MATATGAEGSEPELDSELVSSEGSLSEGSLLDAASARLLSCRSLSSCRCFFCTRPSSSGVAVLADARPLGSPPAVFASSRRISVPVSANILSHSSTSRTIS